MTGGWIKSTSGEQPLEVLLDKYLLFSTARKGNFLPPSPYVGNVDAFKGRSHIF